jgi:AcrR family transcriptional regulator
MAVEGPMSEAPKRSERKPYTSTLRDRQVAQTRELILDAVTTLLGDRRADEVTTREIAAEAGVSERTVYRHFPDRDALLQGLSQRLLQLDGVKPSFGMGALDDIGPTSRRLMKLLDEHYVTARAEAVFNADPRRFAADTQANTREMRELLAKGLPELGEREQLRIAAVIRCLVSTQAWLRMREEFGVPGTESGPVVAWVIDTIIRELRAGNTPPRPNEDVGVDDAGPGSALTVA